ncbi:hypothetical protein [Psychroflexus montanilacus]|uniref:hypothetical protein n=1 Tax=Psychroflexus montanilacus TaxID=2873598 RepID=UPI001CCE82C2|nr:hypothetical protein [Psychroflexus montanilacus]MBZ9652403.1 hypothetical protein [Psychroflexus montanilacus]
MNKTEGHNFSMLILLPSKMILVLVLLFNFSMHAQDREIRKDSLKINDSIIGIAEYEYDKSRGETVYDGKFNFQSVTESKLKSFDFEAITYEGEFSSDKKTGDWLYSNKKMIEGDQKFVSGFRVGNLASGTENLVSGQFQDGVAVGNWKVVKQDYINSNVEDTLFLIESTFKNNQLVGSLKSNSKSILVQGYFNADGYFHGEWEIEHKDEKVIENRTFEAGLLKKYEIIIDGKTFDISYAGLDTTIAKEEQWEDITLEDGYFDILNLVDLEVEQSVSSSIDVSLNTYHKKTNEFIENSILSFSYNTQFDIWNAFKGSKPLGLGKFKVRKLELTSKEKKQVNEIAENFDEIQAMLKEFQDNSKVKIGKPVYEKFNEAELIFNVYRNEMSQLKKLVNVVTSDAFVYIQRDDIYNRIWPKLRFPVEVTYEFQSELVTKSHKFPNSPEREDFDLEKANLLINDIYKDVKAISEEVSEIFEAMEVEKSLSEDEEKLIKKKDKIESLFDANSKEENYNSLHERYSNLVLELTEECFNAYGNLEVDKKKKEIKNLLSCFDNLIDFYEFLEDLKSKNERLDDAYTNTTFNPYMMVDMSERIKENIYEAFDESLKPYLLDKLSGDFSCGKLENAMEDINKVYQKMLDLSKRDTKAEERELRRQKDPEKILSVLEIDLKY